MYIQYESVTDWNVQMWLKRFIKTKSFFVRGMCLKYCRRLPCQYKDKLSLVNIVAVLFKYTYLEYAFIKQHTIIWTSNLAVLSV